MKAKVKRDFILNNNYYSVNDDIELDSFDYPSIIKMNENGFIEALTIKQLYQIKKGVKNNFSVNNEIKI